MNKWEFIQGLSVFFIIGLFLQLLTSAGSNVENEWISDIIGIFLMVFLFLWAREKKLKNDSQAEKNTSDSQSK